MSGQSPPPTVVERLAERLGRPVTDETRRRAALHVLDWTGCAMAGAREPAAKSMAAAVAGRPGAEVLYLGALGNILEMDDIDKRAILHPGPVIIPAAIIAAGEDADADGFLDAIVRGYEAMIRIGRAVGPDHYRYWHNTGTCGPFGAAAAAAALFGLNTRAAANAMSLAGVQASGFWQVRHEPESHAKQLHTARAAHAGLLAAQLSKSGFIGVKSILEGEQGFFAATCGDADAEGVLDFGPTDGWAIEEVSFKPWPACRHAHAAIDAALALKREGAAAGNIESVHVRTYGDAVLFCDRPSPQNTLAAKFSLQHAVAICLLRGEPALEDFDPATIDDRAISAFRNRIEVAADDEFTARYPARFGAAVDLVLKNGDKKSSTVPDALGDPENPAPATLVVEKARRLMGIGGLSNQDADDLVDAALALGEGGDFRLYRRRLFAGLGR